MSSDSRLQANPSEQRRDAKAGEVPPAASAGQAEQDLIFERVEGDCLIYLLGMLRPFLLELSICVGREYALKSADEER